MNFFINLIKKLFNKNKIKYISAPLETKENRTSTSIEHEEIVDSFRVNLMYQTNPEISDGNGYKIQKVSLKDMVWKW